eukprot:8549533-Heterocapsa_arctica.AAC.1
MRRYKGHPGPVASGQRPGNKLLMLKDRVHQDGSGNASAATSCRRKGFASSDFIAAAAAESL